MLYMLSAIAENPRYERFWILSSYLGSFVTDTSYPLDADAESSYDGWMKFWKTFWAAFGTFGSLVLHIYDLPGRIAAFQTWKGWLPMNPPVPVEWVLWSIGITLTAWMFILEWRDFRAPFDMPIRDAVRHVVATTTNSYDRPSLAEEAAFRTLHADFCNRRRRLPVLGQAQDSGPLERIPRKKCRALEPLPVVVPKKPTAPNGIVFALFKQPVPSEPREFSLTGPSPMRFYWSLRVRSKDLYRIWPQVMSQ